MTLLLQDYQLTQSTSAAPLEANHPLSRRMSPLATVTTIALQKLQKSYPGFWSEVLSQNRCKIYYAIRYGEADTMLRLSEQILKRDLPLSPKDFQNSVHNAPMAYASIITGLKAGVNVVSDAYLTLDKTIHLAAQRLGTACDDYVLIIHADASPARSHCIAQAETLLLARSPDAYFAPRAKLRGTCLVFGQKACIAAARESTVALLEGRDVGTPDFSATVARPSTRIVANAQGQGVFSDWEVA